MQTVSDERYGLNEQGKVDAKKETDNGSDNAIANVA